MRDLPGIVVKHTESGSTWKYLGNRRWEYLGGGGDGYAVGYILSTFGACPSALRADEWAEEVDHLVAFVREVQAESVVDPAKV